MKDFHPLFMKKMMQFILQVLQIAMVGFSAEGLFLKTDLYGHTGCWSTSIAFTTGNFNVSFDTVSFTQMNVVVADSNITTSPLPGMSLIDICSGIVSVNEINDNYLEIYPNPAQEELMIKHNFTISLVLRIIDISGRVLYEKHLKGEDSEIKLNVSHFKDGIYFLELITEKEKRMKKIIINR